MQLNIPSLKQNRDLTAIAVAPGVQVQDVSWCRDWRYHHDGSFKSVSFSTQSTNDRLYSASGTQTPIFMVSVEHRLLSLQGYDADIITRTESMSAWKGVRILQEAKVRKQRAYKEGKGN